VTLPMLIAGTRPDEAEERGMALLRQVGLAHRSHHRPAELSGGQQQRVAIARALANSPAIVLADEPTGNLDGKTGTEIIELLKDLNRHHGVTVISATHDTKMIDVSDRVFHVSDGSLANIEDRS
jgi:putative ABC transport system ATP-binding protein